VDGGIVRIGPGYIRKPLWIVALFILGAALVGYVSLARFVAGQLIVTSTILIVAYLLITSVSAFGQSLGEDESAPGRWLRTRMGLEQKTRERLALPLVLLLKGAVIIAAIPFILLLWGFDWFDIAIWLRQALFGFDMGGVRISLFAIMIALLLFALGYMAAKFFQGWLDSYVMERAGVDAGVRDSVRTGVGYVGVALAALLAVSYLGLDFSNLAIVAGALSVGVGYGPPSNVNNFASGLLPLAERPIKAGDWIIVGAQEGIVRKISVRSTEIETFDRANVIVPNSMLITEPVKNCLRIW
jgi:small-conductance mechanosensitive channel